MVMAFFRDRRRSTYLEEPLAPLQERVLRSHLAVYSRLSDAERTRLVQLARVIIAEKAWEGCNGLELTEDMKLIIAAQAALLLLGLDVDPRRDAVYPNVKTILVYPSGFIAQTPRMEGAGVVTEGSANLGEAWYSGPVIVSWRDAVMGGADDQDGRNLVLHEFAHKLDMLDGVVDGTPPLPARGDYARWTRVMTLHFNDLRRSAQLRIPHVLNYYGATNAAEFFAVSTEAFFERSAPLKQYLPELYHVLAEYYGQDPAERV